LPLGLLQAAPDGLILDGLGPRLQRAGPLGIRVNSVRPGYMPPMLNATNVNERADKIALTPLRRLGEPIEVAYGLPVTRIVIACLPVENTGRRYGPGSGAGIGRPLPLPRPCERPPKAAMGARK
jgi:hypothetical protein